LNDPVSNLKKKLTEKYIWTVVFKNNGKTVWPENVKLYCVSGIYKGQAQCFKAVNPGEGFHVDLELIAPEKEGKYTV